MAKARVELNSLSNVNIKSKIDTGGISSAAASNSGELQQIQNLTNQISNTKLQITGPDSGGLSGIQGQLKQVQADCKSLKNTLSQEININLNLDSALGSCAIKEADNSSQNLLDTLGKVSSTINNVGVIGRTAKSILPNPD